MSVLHHMKILQLITVFVRYFPWDRLSVESVTSQLHTRTFGRRSTEISKVFHCITSRFVWAFSRFTYSPHHLAYQISCLRYPILFSFQLFSTILTNTDGIVNGVGAANMDDVFALDASRETNLIDYVSFSLFVRQQRNSNRSRKSFFRFFFCATIECSSTWLHHTNRLQFMYSFERVVERGRLFVESVPSYKLALLKQS